MPPSGGKMALYIMLFHKRKACPEKLIIGIFVTFGAKIRVFASHLKIAQCAIIFKTQFVGERAVVQVPTIKGQMFYTSFLVEK